MSGAAGAGDDQLEALRLRAAGEIIKTVGRSVGGDDSSFIGNGEPVQRLGGMAHGLPVRLAAHDNGNQRLLLCGHVSIFGGGRIRR
jgi:hypothetical protein